MPKIITIEQYNEITINPTGILSITIRKLIASGEIILATRNTKVKKIEKNGDKLFIFTGADILTIPDKPGLYVLEYCTSNSNCIIS